MSEPQQPLTGTPWCQRSGPRRLAPGVAAFVRSALVRPGMTASHLLLAAEALDQINETGDHRAAARDLRHIAAYFPAEPSAPERVDPARLVLRGHGVTSRMLTEASTLTMLHGPVRALLARLARACELEEGHSP